MPIPTFIFPSAPALSASAIYALDVFADKPVFQPESASFTRATTATRTNSSGLIETVAAGIARVDWSGSGAPNTLLEPQRTNLLTYSEQFNSGSWIKVQATLTPNTTLSPDGILNAYTWELNGVSATHNLFQNITFTSGSNYTVSLFVKKDTNDFIQITAATAALGSTFYVNFDIANGVVGTSGAAVLSSNIEDYGNGWYRISATGVGQNTASNPIIFILVDALNAPKNQSNVLTTSVFLWGAQLEVGTYPTTYIPTTSTSVTRNADVFTLSNVYTSGKITSAGGTWFVDLRNNVQLSRDSSGQGGFILSTDTNTVSGDGFNIRHTGGNTRLAIQTYISGISAAVTYIPTDNSKIAIKWNGTTADYFINGIKLVSGFSFSPTALQFMYGNGGQVPKYINSAALYSTPLSDADCIELTTL
jgi:hypothetical protein